MFKELLLLAQAFLRIYGFRSLAWFTMQITAFTIFRYLTIMTDMTKDPHFFISSSPVFESLLFFLAGILFIGFLSLIIFLGHTFSSAQRSNWIRQMPLNGFTLHLFPLLIIFLYGSALVIFFPWGAFKSGISFFTIGIPIALFLILKNSKNFFIGIWKSALGAIGLLSVWMFLFYDWSVFQPPWIVELLAIALCSGIWLLLGKQERLYSLSVSFMLLIFLSITTLFNQWRIPQDFTQATLDHAFFPTQKTWNWFKKIALESSYWESVNQFNLPLYVRNKSQNFIEDFSDSEKIQFIKNIENNREKWQGHDTLEYRPMRFDGFPQPQMTLNNYSLFPIGKNNINENIEEYLYTNWRDSRLYCQLLPFRKSNRYLEKLFLFSECTNELFHQAPWFFYSFTEYEDYEKQFDQYLLQAFDKSPPKTRSKLMFFLRSGWGLDESKEKYEKERDTIFNQKPLTIEQLDQIKKDRYRRSLMQIKKLSSLNREEFLQQVEATDVRINSNGPQETPTVPLWFLCAYLQNDCDSFLDQKKSESLSLIENWFLRAHDLTFNNVGIWVHWFKSDIHAPKNWPKIEKIREYVKNREDL